MHFDHLDGETKEGNISAMVRVRGMTVEKLMREIAKCQAVCANCHADRTYRRANGIPIEMRIP